MRSLLNDIYKKAASNPQRIILPEANDIRVISAAAEAASRKIARPILLGEQEDIIATAKRHSIKLKLDKIEIQNPAEFDRIGEFIDEYFHLSQAKGVTLQESEKIIRQNSVFLAAMMIRHGLADGFVAGARFTTRDVARAAIQCIGLDKDVGIITSAFLMMFKDAHFGENGLFLFADCAIIPDPSAKQLAKIALSSARLMQQLFDFTPRIAMLSYSTRGSGHGPTVDKVVEATKLAKEEAPDMLIEGELQADTALIKEVAMVKFPDSLVAGKANVLIFPDLNAGNIGYKLSQRFGKARALGPFLMGTNRPCSDLSRGCTKDEIVDIVAITSVRAQNSV